MSAVLVTTCLVLVACIIIIVLVLIVRQTFVIPVACTMHVANVTGAGATNVITMVMNICGQIVKPALEDAAWSALRRRE